MKTAIIDRSLAGLNFHEITKKSDVYMYVCSLLESGVDFVEIDLNALTRLPKPNGSEKYIFRIEKPDEYAVANAFPFSYAVVPLRLSYLINKIRIPVLLEINIGEVDPFSLVKVVADSIDLTSVSLLRLLGNFRAEEIFDLSRRLRAKYATPIDICPLNSNMTALSSAITAYASRVGSVSFGFGGSGNSAALEEFLIALSSMYGAVITKNYISGICKAAMLSFLISRADPGNLNLIMKRYSLCSQKIVNIDNCSSETINGEYKYFYIKKRKSAAEKKLSRMKIDDEVSEKIAEVLKTCGIDFYSEDEAEVEMEMEKALKQ